MKRLLILACLVLPPLAFAVSAHAADKRSFAHLRSFIGLWQGIDAVDGGDALRAITCSRDGACALVGTDSVVSLCDGGPAFVTGAGGFEGHELVFPDAVFHCSDGNAVTFSVSFERDRLNRTLISSGVVDGERFRSIVYHRISQ